MAEPFYKAVAYKKQVKQAKPDFKKDTKSSDSRKQPFTKQAVPEKQPSAAVVRNTKMFDADKIADDAKAVLENFDDIIQSVRPLNAKQRALFFVLFHNFLLVFRFHSSEFSLGIL